MVTVAPGQPHGTHWFGRRTTVRPGHAAHRHGKARAAGGLGAADHGFDHFLADRANLAEQRSGHSQLTGFLGVGIGHVPSLEPGRAAGHAGDGLGDAATGAGFGGGHLRVEAAQVFTQAGGKRGDRVHVGLLEGWPLP
ncbi:hypothetical protein D3C75_1140890 [compost metagenome]